MGKKFHKDLTNLYFGKYKVLGYSGNSKWKCKCKCGKISFVRTADLNNGNSKGCRKCQNRLNQKGKVGLNNLYSKYKIRSLKYKEDIDIDIEEFKKLTSMNCHYCGVEPKTISKSSTHTSEETKKHSEYLYNGLDRVDSNKGYLKENVVPCCETCNKAKRDLSLCQFKKWINRLIKYNNNV